MRILIACEFSGIVRDSFKQKGHDVWSCDLRQTERPGKHIQGDVLKYLNEGWDMMIGHPPCTYLSYAGMAFWNDPGRLKKRLEALQFFAELWMAPIEKICLENPKGCASPTIASYSQIIEPYFFGDQQRKKTLLWLKNLPLLKHNAAETLFDLRTHTDKPLPLSRDKSGKARYFVDSKVRDPYARSKTFLGIAQAMAEQWG